MDVKLPNLGEGADSGVVVNLFVKEGDEITRDQPILELENEKAVATIPSSAAGTITKIFVKTGDKISVGQKLLSLSEKDEGRKPGTTEPKPEAAARRVRPPDSHSKATEHTEPPTEQQPQRRPQS